ncbi:MAG: hypothetical protein U0768_21480 [Anaerolineae bacterium]
MYATMRKTEQWFSHHHLALALLIALLAVVIVDGARYLTLPQPAPVVTQPWAPSAAYSAAMTRYQAVKEAQAEMLDRTVAAPAHSEAALAAMARYGSAKEAQAEMLDRTVAAPAHSEAALAAMARYGSAKEAQAETQDRTVAPAIPAAVTDPFQRYQDMKERQAETQDRSPVPVPVSGPSAAQARYGAMKEAQAEMQDRTVAMAGPTAAQNAVYQRELARLRDLNTSGDPELDAGLLPGAFSDTRSGPH